MSLGELRAEICTSIRMLSRNSAYQQSPRSAFPANIPVGLKFWMRTLWSSFLAILLLLLKDQDKKIWEHRAPLYTTSSLTCRNMHRGIRILGAYEIVSQGKQACHAAWEVVQLKILENMVWNCMLGDKMLFIPISASRVELAANLKTFTRQQKKIKKYSICIAGLLAEPSVCPYWIIEAGASCKAGTFQMSCVLGCFLRSHAMSAFAESLQFCIVLPNYRTIVFLTSS